jgi:hypothetical protein
MYNRDTGTDCCERAHTEHCRSCLLPLPVFARIQNVLAGPSVMMGAEMLAKYDAHEIHPLDREKIFSR